jgi:hypothetical protein
MSVRWAIFCYSFVFWPWRLISCCFCSVISRIALVSKHKAVTKNCSPNGHQLPLPRRADVLSTSLQESSPASYLEQSQHYQISARTRPSSSRRSKSRSWSWLPRSSFHGLWWASGQVATDYRRLRREDWCCEKRGRPGDWRVHKFKKLDGRTIWGTSQYL